MTLTNNIVNDFFCAMDVRMFDENDDEKCRMINLSCKGGES